jgi:hypothetical protein
VSFKKKEEERSKGFDFQFFVKNQLRAPHHLKPDPKKTTPSHNHLKTKKNLHFITFPLHSSIFVTSAKKADQRIAKKDPFKTLTGQISLLYYLFLL